MLYGKILRPPSFGAKLQQIDLQPAKDMQGVTVVQDGEFVGVAAASSFLAEQAHGRTGGRGQLETDAATLQHGTIQPT